MSQGMPAEYMLLLMFLANAQYGLLHLYPGRRCVAAALLNNRKGTNTMPLHPSGSHGQHSKKPEAA
jgi:hypothetical protein